MMFRRSVLVFFALVALSCRPFSTSKVSIIGGDDSKLSIEPVMLLTKQAGQGRGRCTSVVVAPKLILTAAHCVVGADQQPLTPEKVTAFPAGRSMQPRALHISSSYKPDNKGKITIAEVVDLAVLEFAEDLGVVPARLSLNREAEKTEAIASGFGIKAYIDENLLALIEANDLDAQTIAILASQKEVSPELVSQRVEEFRSGQEAWTRILRKSHQQLRSAEATLASGRVKVDGDGSSKFLVSRATFETQADVPLDVHRIFSYFVAKESSGITVLAPGDSGGPIFSESSEVIGINSFVSTAFPNYESSFVNLAHRDAQDFFAELRKKNLDIPNSQQSPPSKPETQPLPQNDKASIVAARLVGTSHPQARYKIQIAATGESAEILDKDCSTTTNRESMQRTERGFISEERPRLDPGSTTNGHFCIRVKSATTQEQARFQIVRAGP